MLQASWVGRGAAGVPTVWERARNGARGGLWKQPGGRLTASGGTPSSGKVKTELCLVGWPLRGGWWPG